METVNEQIAENETEAAENEDVKTENEAVTAENETEAAENEDVKTENEAEMAGNEAVTAENEAETAENEAETAGNEGAAPAESDTAPTESDTAPTESDTAPTESDTAPTESDTAPTESDTAPMEAVAPTEPNTAPTGSDNAEQDALDTLAELRRELDSLRERLEQQHRAMQRMSRECDEFAELYPDCPISSLPREVWEQVRAGIPLAAAYAYVEARRSRRERLAADANERNEQSSAGDVCGRTADYFSAAEVRRMTPEEVRSNYSKIMDSMKLWN